MADDKQPLRHSAFAKALCLDLPYILDSVWRRGEFNLNRLVRYEITCTSNDQVTGRVSERPFVRIPAFWFFLVTLVFVAYGPTFDAWCSVVGARGTRSNQRLPFRPSISWNCSHA